MKTIATTAERIEFKEWYLSFKVHADAIPILVNFFKGEEKRKNKYYRLSLSLPHRSRSTGWRSQNHRINGHCQVLAAETGNDFAMVKLTVKQQALSRGYPFKRDDQGAPLLWTFGPLKGEPVPISEADASVDDAKLLIEEINQLAAEIGITLPECDNEGAIW